MNILITGMNGFVGSLLRQTLIQKGHRVSGIDTCSAAEDLHRIDITDSDALTRCVRTIEPDFIFHLAAISRVDYADPSKLYAINVTGTMNLLAAAARLDKKPGVLLVSSSQVYGIVEESRQPISEHASVNPVNHYGASKAAAENIASAFHNENGLPVVIVRPFNHIGRGQDQNFFIPKIITSVKEKKADIKLGNLTVVRDFLDVRDVIDAYVQLMEKFPDGGTFNVAGGTGYRLSDLVDLIQETAGFTFNISSSNTLMRKNEIVKAIGDSSLLRQTTGWRPVRSIKETIEWMLI